MARDGSAVMTEAQIVEGCRSGDREARHTLYAQTVDRIYRLLLRMTRNADDAFDLAQQTYINAFTRIHQFDGRSALGTWVYRIAVTEGLQWLRRSRRGDASRDGPPARPAAAGDQQAVDVRLDVDAALAQLDPLERTMLLLRYDAGEDYASIARIVGCAEGTVASRLHRARERMRGLLRASYALREETSRPVHPIR